MRWPGLLLLLNITCAFAQETTPADEPTAFADVTEAARGDGDADAFNRTVSDAEIDAWMRFLLQSDPHRLQQWDRQSAAERSAAIAEHRRTYVSRGMRIPVMRGMTAKEVEELTHMTQLAAASFARLQRARELLPRLNHGQLLIVRSSCVELLARHPRSMMRNVRTPDTLEFLQPDLIRLDRDACTVFLQKGLGDGFGLLVRKEGERWRLYRFDTYQSWDHVEIALD